MSCCIRSGVRHGLVILAAAAILAALAPAARAETIPATETDVSQYVWNAGVPEIRDGYVYTLRDPKEPFSPSFLPIIQAFCGAMGTVPRFTRNPAQLTEAVNCNFAPGNMNNPPPVANGRCGFVCDNFAIGDGYGSVAAPAWVEYRKIYTCPSNQNWTLTGAFCSRPDCTGDFKRSASTGMCLPDPELKDPVPPELCDGNPVNSATGLKTQFQTLLGPAAPGGLEYSLTYGSRLNAPVPRFAHGAGWINSHERSLTVVAVDPVSIAPTVIVARRPSGSSVVFRLQPGGDYAADADADRLIHYPTNGSSFEAWVYLDARANNIESYGPFLGNGMAMLAHVNPAAGGGSTALSSGSQFAGISEDGSGRYVLFTYDTSGRVSKTTYAGTTSSIGFDYDASNNLVRITWQDNTSRSFLYEDARFPNNLTGIVDENGDRFATWTYDALGRATNSQHAGGADEVTFSFGPTSSVTTDSLGAARVRTFTVVQGVTRGATLSQPGGSGCGAASSAMSYDGNGNVASVDDFVGNRTCYGYDLSRNLETTRVEGLPQSTSCGSVIGVGSALPAGARRISTRWHPEWTFAIGQAQPGKLATYVYNGQPDPFAGGAIASCAPINPALSPPLSKPLTVVCKQVEQATSDVDGSTGFSAGLQPGVPNRQSSWTYNGAGQVLAANLAGSGTTTFAYNNRDLASITNAVGHVTQLSGYDFAGRATRTVLPGGAAIDTQYTARGWPQVVTVTPVGAPAQATTYSYDAVGQLKLLTLPNGSTVQYRYDPAHRLIGLTDGGGNSVDYTLDTKGNRISERRKDVDGNLARTVTRAFDALGRLESVTGARK